jgi:murein DD-endopeptidase MepM/ murein hydrolase activator NlpD
MKKCLYIILIISLLLIIFTSLSLAYSLKLGNKGIEVEKLQKQLAKIGYDINIDGIYGYRTKEIIKDFQLNNGLIVDGIAGKKTQSFLEEVSKDIIYIVKPGDTLSEIALNNNSTVSSIIKRNNLKSNKIIIGQELNIPKTGLGGGEERKLYDNIIHEIQKGDALSLLAKKYGTNVETIKLANNLRSDCIYVGQSLLIPHLKSGSTQNFYLAKGSIIWPVLGRISSPFGWRIHPISNKREFHEGIDIAVPVGTKIRASASGTVIQSGWISGFGYTIIIDHGNGVRTLYGHNSRLFVYGGTNVKIGEVIALAGSTGRSTGPHLHFGLFLNGKTINPKIYLP